jgi:hypothetical protein
MHVMEQAVTYHSEKCFRTQGIFLSPDMPFSNINSIGQRGMPKDGLLGDIEHRIGKARALALLELDKHHEC